MSTMKNVPVHHQAVILDTSDSRISRLVIEIPPEQEQAVQSALETLSRMETGVSAQTIVLDALRVAAEQTYFWTPEWQAKEQAADQAIAERRVWTFDTMDQMLDFLDRPRRGRFPSAGNTSTPSTSAPTPGTPGSPRAMPSR
jgi:hypothetical protein